MADEVRIAVCAFELEISVVRREPDIQHLRNGYPAITKNQRARRLLPAMACVTLDADAEQPRLRHLIYRQIFARS